MTSQKSGLESRVSLGPAPMTWPLWRRLEVGMGDNIAPGYVERDDGYWLSLPAQHP